MASSRRNFLKNVVYTLAFSVLFEKLGFTSPKDIAAWPDQAFGSKKLEEAMANLFNQTEVTETNRIQLNSPDVAQDGAIVPVKINCSLEQVDRITIFVENNPVPLIADFELHTDAEAFVSTRIKMADSDNIVVIARARNQLYSIQKYVEVAIGGC